MNKKVYIIPLLILPMLAACKDKNTKGDFLIGNSQNQVIEITYSELSAKLNVQKDTFFVATHQGFSCTCWTGFQFLVQEYTKNTSVPIYGFDTDLLPDTSLGIDKVSSGYVELYVVIEGEIVKKYSKTAKIDYDMFEKVDKFTETVEKYINKYPISNYAYASYEYVCDLFKDSNNEFVLLTVRSGCGDCNYSMPNVITPWMQENGSKIPVYVCDIEKYRGTDIYDVVKGKLNLTSESSQQFGYGDGVVPTYQYYKNGTLMDVGVYANDNFELNGDKIQAKSYFDGNRDLKYTTRNLKQEFENSSELPNQLNKVGDIVYLPTEKEAVYHDSIIKDFLSYYCK